MLSNYILLFIISTCFSTILTPADENPAAEKETPGANASGHRLPDVANNVNNKIIDGSASIKSTRHNLKLSKVFEFKTFKKLFRKKYNSVLDEVVRSRLFQARAFRVFISIVKYKHDISSSYFAINHMSDWTENDIDSIYLSESVLSPLNDNLIKSELPISSSDKLRHAFISKEKHLKYYNKKGKSTLEKLSELRRHQRSKRETCERNLLLKDLIRVPKQEEDLLIKTLLENATEGYKNDTDQSLKSPELDLSNTQVVVDEVPVSGISLRKLSKRLFSWKGSATTRRDERELTNDAELVIARSESAVKEEKVEFNIDHRKCMTPIKEQHKCASCYAFATVALYEWAYCKATTKQLAFSEQYILDYGDHIEGLEGCNGGIFTKVGDFVKKYGLELAVTYPYLGGVSIGPYCGVRSVTSQNMGYVRLDEPTFWAIPSSQINNYLKKTPLIVNIINTGHLSEYGGGIDSGTGCLRGKHRYHSILLVGSGQENGQEFWLMRNSFSNLWGESGYYRLNKESRCIHPAWAYALKGTFNKDPKKNINKNNDPGFVKRKFIRDLKKAEREKQFENGTLNNKLPTFT